MFVHIKRKRIFQPESLFMVLRGYSTVQGLLGGSGDLVSRVISNVAIVTSILVRCIKTLLTKSHDPPSRAWGSGLRA